MTGIRAGNASLLLAGLFSLGKDGNSKAPEVNFYFGRTNHNVPKKTADACSDEVRNGTAGALCLVSWFFVPNSEAPNLAFGRLLQNATSQPRAKCGASPGDLGALGDTGPSLTLSVGSWQLRVLGSEQQVLALGRQIWCHRRRSYRFRESSHQTK